MKHSPLSHSQEGPKWQPVIHLYWAYTLTRVEEMFKVTRFPPGVCGAQTEREYVTNRAPVANLISFVEASLERLKHRTPLCLLRVDKRIDLGGCHWIDVGAA